MTFSKKLHKAFTAILSITMAMLICISGGFLHTKMTASAASNVATLKIFSDGSGLYGTHAFISITNISRSNIKVLNSTIAPGKSMTVGTWGNKGEGAGIYINLEAKKISMNRSEYKNRVSLSMNITSSQLNTVNNTMKRNNKWAVGTNCASFASTVWNSVAPTNRQVTPGSVLANPRTLSGNIKKRTGYRTGESVGNCDLNYVKRYYNDNRIVTVSYGSVKSSSSSSSSS